FAGLLSSPSPSPLPHALVTPNTRFYGEFRTPGLGISCLPALEAYRVVQSRHSSPASYLYPVHENGYLKVLVILEGYEHVYRLPRISAPPPLRPSADRALLHRMDPPTLQIHLLGVNNSTIIGIIIG
ncbi:2201_t:CDS:1, partial [Acaulospora colombiana]